MNAFSINYFHLNPKQKTNETSMKTQVRIPYFSNQDCLTKSKAPMARNSQDVFRRSKAWSSPGAMSNLIIVSRNFSRTKSTNLCEARIYTTVSSSPCNIHLDMSALASLI